MCLSPELDDDYGDNRVPDRQVMDHCNGLLLLGWNLAVVNPAMRQWWYTLPSFLEPLLSLRLSPPEVPLVVQGLRHRYWRMMTYGPASTSPTTL